MKSKIQKFDDWHLLKRNPDSWISGICISNVFLSLEPSYILYILHFFSLDLKSQLISACPLLSIETLSDIEEKEIVYIKYFF